MLPQTPYDPIFEQTGQKYGVDASLLKAIASVESSFNPQAVGPETRSGRAQGLMQFVPAMQKAYGIQDPFDPQQSVDAAGRMMRDLLKRYEGDVGKALEAYNGGPSLVGKSKQTAEYRDKVLSRFAPATEVDKLALTINASQRPPAMNQGPRTVSRGTPTTDQFKPLTKQSKSAAKVSAMDLPASYKTALALNYMVDTDPEDKIMGQVREVMGQMMGDGGGGAPAGSKILQEYYGSKPVDPFQFLRGDPNADQEPRNMAQGGEVRKYAIGGDVVPYYEDADRVRNLAAMLPAGWENFSPQGKIDWFNQNNVTIDELMVAGVPQSDIDYMLDNGYGGGFTAPVTTVLPTTTQVATTVQVTTTKAATTVLPTTTRMATTEVVTTKAAVTTALPITTAAAAPTTTPATTRLTVAPGATVATTTTTTAKPTTTRSTATGTVKGRTYSVADADDLFDQLMAQQKNFGVSHRASFSNKNEEILRDMANQFASYGVTNLADLQPIMEEKQYWKVPRYESDEVEGSVFTGKYDLYDQDPNASYDGPSPTPIREASEDDLAQLDQKGTIATRTGVLNAKTGQAIPMNKLNNSAGDGFTYYHVEFAGGIPIPYAYKEKTGLGALTDQIVSIASLPPIAAVLTTMTAGAFLPTMGSVVSSYFPAMSAANQALLANAMANAAASSVVTAAITGDITKGLEAGGSSLVSSAMSYGMQEAVAFIDDQFDTNLYDSIYGNSGNRDPLTNGPKAVVPTERDFDFIDVDVPDINVPAVNTGVIPNLSSVVDAAGNTITVIGSTINDVIAGIGGTLTNVTPTTTAAVTTKPPTTTATTTTTTKTPVNTEVVVQATTTLQPIVTLAPGVTVTTAAPITSVVVVGTTTTSLKPVVTTATTTKPTTTEVVVVGTTTTSLKPVVTGTLSPTDPFEIVVTALSTSITPTMTTGVTTTEVVTTTGATTTAGPTTTLPVTSLDPLMPTILPTTTQDMGGLTTTGGPTTTKKVVVSLAPEVTTIGGRPTTTRYVPTLTVPRFNVPTITPGDYRITPRPSVTVITTTSAPFGFNQGGEVAVRRTPSLAEVPFAMGEAPPPPVETERPTLDKLVGAGEAGLAVLSSMFGQPAAALYSVGKAAIAPNVPIKERGPLAEAEIKKLSPQMMYQPRTEAGQEALQGVSKFLQDTKLDAAMPQAQLMRPLVGPKAGQYALQTVKDTLQKAGDSIPPMSPPMVPAMAGAGVGAVPRGAPDLGQQSKGIMDLAAPMKAVGDAKPQKQQVDVSLLMPSPEKPFVGELERRIADLKGPMTKSQFLGFLKNKQGREYEMVRAEEALKDFGDNDKITPAELMEAVKATSPQRYTLEIKEPVAGKTFAYQRHDNPYQSLPMGSVNLLMDIPQETQRLIDVAEIVRKARTSSRYAHTLGVPKEINEIEKNVDLFPRAAQKSLDEYKQLANKLETNQNKIREIEDGFSVSGAKLSSIEGKKSILNYGFDETLPKPIQDILAASGMPAKTTNDLKKYVKEKSSADEAQKILSIRSNAAVLHFFRKNIDEALDYLAPFGDESSGLRVLGKYAKKATEKLAADGSIDDSVFKDYKTQLSEWFNDRRTEYSDDMHDLMIDIENRLPTTSIYKGSHTGVVDKNPIAFSRFVDLDAAKYNLPDSRGAMMFTELQSDRYKDVKPIIPETEIEVVRDANGRVARGANGDPLFRTIVKKDPNTGKPLMIANPTYDPDLEPAYPGMADLSPGIVQQLIIKNTVAAAAQRGKGIVLFPSTDSSKANLYTKVGENVKQVVKDLGPGYETRQFDVPNDNGDVIKRWGIMLPQDAAEEVKRKGIRFSKGGLVDKPLYDRNK